MAIGVIELTVPVFFVVVPAGYAGSSSARFTTGPLTRNGSVGRRPCDGPGIDIVGRERHGERVGRHSRPTTIGVKLEYDVFWK